MKNYGYLLILLTASACNTTAQHHVNPLAAPPSFDVVTTAPDTHYDMNSPDALAEPLNTLVPPAHTEFGLKEKTLTLSAAEGVGCNIQDRFDRKALLAYEWGNHSQSRLGLDVDGIGFDGGKLEGVMLQYSFRLQPEKPRKMGCRYQSQWQGMIGSGYNEMFMRPEGEGAKADFKELRQDLETRMETLWD